MLRRRVKDTVPVLMSPDDFVRDGWGTDETLAFGLGHHPDYTARVWDALAEGLPGEAVKLVSGTPALVDPVSGRLVAFVSGMTYMVRVPESHRVDALAAGYESVFTDHWPHERGDPPDFGSEWVRGRWKAIELGWVRSFIAPASGAET